MDEQINSLISENDELRKRSEELEDENASLWFMLDEMRNSQNSIGETVQEMLKEKLEEEYYKSFKPVGDA